MLAPVFLGGLTRVLQSGCQSLFIKVSGIQPCNNLSPAPSHTGYKE
jgi:hypothetical protein